MTDTLRYDRLFETALRDVIRRILKQVAEQGLPGNHYFEITFNTDFVGVKMSESLKTRHGSKMTIILQRKFEQLRAEQKAFAVVLYFNNRPQRLEIPYRAISEFTDPEAKFSLQFQGFTAARPKHKPKNPALPKIVGQKIVKLDEYRKAKT